MGSESRTIRVLLVDDHAVVRVGYTMLLETTQDIQVVAEAGTASDACLRYVEHQPDVVIMDLSLPKVGGLEAIRRIRLRDPQARVLVFSMYDDPLFVERALLAGARGYTTKTSAPGTLIEAVKDVAAGRIHLDDEIAQRLAYRITRGDSSPLSELSGREFEIFRLLASGMKMDEIALELSISYKTVANYSTRIKTKLGVTSTAELARLSVRHGVDHLAH